MLEIGVTNPLGRRLLRHERGDRGGAATRPSAAVRLPTDARMRVVWGGDELRCNQHAAFPDQRWAYDLVVESPASSWSCWRWRSLLVVLAIMVGITGVSFAFAHWLNRRAARKLRAEAARLLEATGPP